MTQRFMPSQTAYLELITKSRSLMYSQPEQADLSRTQDYVFLELIWTLPACVRFWIVLLRVKIININCDTLRSVSNHISALWVFNTTWGVIALGVQWANAALVRFVAEFIPPRIFSPAPKFWQPKNPHETLRRKKNALAVLAARW